MTNEEPKKLYLLPNGLISFCRNTDEDIEYTHTDALIDKACEWWENELTSPTMTQADIDDFVLSRIKEFKRAMKGGDNE